jgi:hypothetical protein
MKSQFGLVATLQDLAALAAKGMKRAWKPVMASGF